MKRTDMHSRAGSTMAAAACVLAALLAARGAAQLSTVYPVPLYSAGPGFDVLGVDLDLDGRTDVVSGDLPLFVDFALPAGGFAPPVLVPAGTVCTDFTSADVDGNGWPDIVGAGDTKFSVVLAPGGGALLPGTIYYVGTHIHGVGAGDVDGDGLVDVVTSSDSTAAALNVNSANGTGGFLATVVHPLALKAVGVQLADLDADGRLDAAFTTDAAPYVAAVCLGDGAGGFGAPVSSGMPNYPFRLIVRDVDADGDLDLVLPCEAAGPAGVVAVVRGDGAGALAAPETWPVTPGPTSLDLGDLDGNGLPDIVATTFNQDTVSVLLADGAGGYLPAQTHASSGRISQVVLADATADGLLDAIGWSWSGESLAVMAGDGTGGLQACERYAIDAPLAVAVADLDVDGHPDLLAVTGRIATLLADGQGGFLPPAYADFPPYPLNQGAGEHVAAGDVTGDGLPDLLMPSDNALVLFRNAGAGGLLDGTVVPGSGSGFDVALADLDGDGDLDAVEAHSLNLSTFPYPGVLLRYLGEGVHGLQPPDSFDAGSQPMALALGDVDDDGHPDAVDVNYFGAGLSVMRGDGLGGFAAPLESAYASGQEQIALGDLDLDGHLDAATLRHYGNVTTLHGDGQGTMQAIGTWTSPGGAYSGNPLGIADVDGDGWPDVVYSGGTTESVNVRPNDGTGALLPALLFAAGDAPLPLALADLDGDHRPDAVAGVEIYQSQDDGALAVLRNGADFRWTDLGSALPGAFGAPQLAGTGALVSSTPGDLRLFHARPASLAALFIAASSVPASFKGGTLVAVPPIVTFFLVTDGAGSITIGWSAWPSSAPGQDWFFQYGIKDADAVKGVALSNALKAVEP